MKNYRAAIYLRLSKDDGKDESSGIESQRMMLLEYAEKNGYRVVKEYCDDGYSGTAFDRPAFIEMLKDAKNGSINMIIVKDLSRLGRDYIRTGRFIEEYFPENNIRFIAVNDGFDTDDEDGNELAPFRNVINEMYARDISRKIRSALYAKMRAGQFVGNFPPYGYKKQDHRLVPDDSGKTVELIFSLACGGKSAQEIADDLNALGILSPLEYRAASLGKDITPVRWSSGGVRKIIKNPVYTGALIQGKTRKLNFKSKTCRTVPQELRHTVPNAHKPLVTAETFALANRLISFNRNSLRKDPLSGFAFCGVCGRKLSSVNPFASCPAGCLKDFGITCGEITSTVDKKLGKPFSSMKLSERASELEKILVFGDRIELVTPQEREEKNKLLQIG